MIEPKNENYDNKLEYIYLSDFPINKTFVYLENSLKNKLLENSIKKAESQRMLANLINLSLNYPKIRQSIISEWLKKDFIRLDIIFFLNKYTELNIDLDNNIKMLKGQSTSRQIINPKFPICINEELVSILANLYCDGTTSDLDSHTTEYFNQEYTLISKIKNNFDKVFGEVNITERYIEDTRIHNIRIPHYLGRLFCKKFDLIEDNVPKVIKNSQPKIQGQYLRAVFDDEGTISKGYSQIRLKMKKESYVNDIKSILLSLGIESSDIYLEKYVKGKFGLPCYYFNISGYYNIKNFADKVGFDHPKKLIRLKDYLEKIKEHNYGYKANKKVLDILKIKGQMNKKQIALLLDRNDRTVQHHLNNLLKDNLVKFKKVWKGYSYEYIWYAKRK